MAAAKRPTNIYVDGFNLYYGALKGTPFKWLDLLALCRDLLEPTNEIQHIYYFTARVRQRYRNDPGPNRQDLYFRALQTLPCVSLHFGNFLEHAVDMPKWPRTPQHGPPEMVRVMKTDEKGTDVALATQLVADAYQHACEVAVVITNDSDQVPPIRHLVQELNMTVGILNPEREAGRRSKELKNAARFFKAIGPSALARCQFPARLRDNTGPFTCPPRWLPPA